MPSPFPGVDPYIESSGMWGDFHGAMLSVMRADLNSNLPRGYAASIELYVWAGEKESRRSSAFAKPDVRTRQEEEIDAGGTAMATIAAPSTILLPRRVHKRRKYLKIVDIHSKQIVTIIELLSQSNKKIGDDRIHYLQKRDEYLANGLNFVEIDLLQAGRRPPLGKNQLGLTDFYVLVSRSWRFPEAGIWTFGLRDQLPEIPVPVTEEVGDTPLHLRLCMDRSYDEGRYSTSLPYDEPLKPRPHSRDRDWIGTVMANRPR
jgi:Protein of unknown function (DUF4058)